MTEAEAKAKKQRKARIDIYTKGHGYSFLPEVTADYLLEELNRIGIVSSGANGLSAITWQDIAAYQSQNHNLLNSWECETLIDMSRTYVRTYNMASDNKMPPPYVTEDPEELAQHEEWVARNDEKLAN